eukprot:760423-Pyramimonas_sp.AAC.1
MVIDVRLRPQPQGLPGHVHVRLCVQTQVLGPKSRCSDSGPRSRVLGLGVQTQTAEGAGESGTVVPAWFLWRVLA